uniref:Translation initiation factor IF-2, chloroplastic n=1 Tax=Osmundaria fimbriata TaxID=228265 RepID=A0A1Z1M4Y6_OSMFI|nr:translation initiation factor 2 [Osmundaria fimbriata]ARW60834.1 translation initiation factor 2 [Osmundaria fimbriata]
MIYTSLNSLMLLSPNLYDIFKFSSLNSFTYSDNMLELTFPKLINFRPVITSSTIDVNHINFVDVSMNTNSNFDRKYKNNSNIVDSFGSKKTKSRLVKKKRNNVESIDNEDVFNKNQDDFLTQDNLNLSLLKSRKLHRIKKKNKTHSDPNDLDAFVGNHNQLNVTIDHAMTVKELANKLNMHEAEIITHLFLQKGISVTINQLLDSSIAKDVVLSYGFNLSQSQSDNNQLESTNLQQPLVSSNNIKRSPIITILGHVDHGKTTLLNSILKTDLTEKEIGGITQAISAYEVEYLHNSKVYNLIFLDTPGHESFKTMRLRGAQVTDIVLLVIAGDDGLRPQTIESIKYIKEMSLECIVVITKSDKISINVDHIQKDLANHGLLTESWGGNLSLIQVSALTSVNIDALLSRICIISDSKELVADPSLLASGTILEAYLDKRQGPIANLVVQNGTLRLGSVVVSGSVYGKVKSIKNTSGIKIISSKPSSIVQILGFSAVPKAGAFFQVVINEKEAKQSISNSFSNETQITDNILKSLNSRVTLDHKNSLKQFKLIIKADTQGSLEAIIDLLSQISQLKVQIHIISANFGNVSTNDIELALSTDSSILTFNINVTSQIIALIKKTNITFKNFNIIYDLLEYVQNFMLSLIDPEYKKVFIGRAFVQAVFKMNKGCVAGCLVNEGKIKRFCYIHVLRNDQLVYEGFLTSLKRMKNDAHEVVAVNECGLMADYDLWEISDTIDAYELISQEKNL